MKGEKIIKSPDTERKNRVPSGQTLTDKWPILHYGDVPEIDVSKWKFTISGLVKKEMSLSYPDFTSLPRVKIFSDIHCVTGWSKLDNLWEGVSTRAIKKLTRILPEAGFAIVHSEGGFTTNLSLGTSLSPMCCLPSATMTNLSSQITVIP
ncbi:MAG: molybdopterin-dependent oxidoreductase [Methanobacteriota archaeon]